MHLPRKLVRWCGRLLGRRPARQPIPLTLWRVTVDQLPVLEALDRHERIHLRALAERFLGARRFYGAEGFVPSLDMKVRIAALACLPVLHLGEDWLDPIRSIVLYADTFIAEHREVDGAGVVHQRRDLNAGEAWENGTMVLSWTDVAAADRVGSGFNVVIHEVAHFLDGANGAENGFPPLARGHDRRAWTADFSAAFEELAADVAAGHPGRIDPYAATAPAEFFAVSSELFFEQPAHLRHAYPAFYRHLARFYRVDRLAA